MKGITKEARKELGQKDILDYIGEYWSHYWVISFVTAVLTFTALILYVH